MKKGFSLLSQMKSGKKTISLLFILMFSLAPLMAAPCGDVDSNGIINIVDALKIAQDYVGLNPSDYDKSVADVNSDGTVNIVDALLVAQYYVGLIDLLPGCGPTPTPTNGTEPTSTSYVLEAESEATWDNATVDTNHAGFTGTGFVNTVNASGTWIEWSIVLSTNTNGICEFTYASANARGADLSINGTVVKELGFANSGAWTTWSKETAVVSLKAGKNTIRLIATTTGGIPNMDKLTLTIGGSILTPTPMVTPTPTMVPTNTPPGMTYPPTPTNDPNEGLVAFPGAEGYGKVATGGRGGKVYNITTLNSTGSGSLGEAISASGARTVVFRVAGTINGNFSITNDNITIAGQTAPGDGIAINGQLLVDANNVIIRYIRVRGKANEDVITNNHNSPKRYQIYDHLSASWSSDEIFSVYFNEHITIQYCMITEAGSSDHKFGGIWGGNYNSFHHNLFAHNTSRNPRIASGSGYNDYRNNVMFNTNQPIHGGEKHEVDNDPLHVFQSINVVNNYVKPGPVNRSLNLAKPGSRDGSNDAGDWYVTGNVLYGKPDVTADNWKGVSGTYNKLSSPSEHMPIRMQTAEEAFETVLEHAGCAMPNRDSLDARIVEEARTGNVQNGNGLVSGPGTLPTLRSGTAPMDSDNDGMPDSWENAHGLNPDNPDDRNNKDSIGYTMLENYINSLDNF